ncbi:hypothetical protein FGO68_gene4306 [Halteria grandinella]|uniref:Uncharacterized protein n=1 Tax=Halteria grandinella TaxID=5974 RepID=A0A8J8T6E8_HALGN|nr:hypothetical protein FGO68_gene4306 [Halteria grandinella]
MNTNRNNNGSTTNRVYTDDDSSSSHGNPTNAQGQQEEKSFFSDFTSTPISGIPRYLQNLSSQGHNQRAVQLPPHVARPAEDKKQQESSRPFTYTPWPIESRAYTIEEEEDEHSSGQAAHPIQIVGGEESKHQSSQGDGSKSQSLESSDNYFRQRTAKEIVDMIMACRPANANKPLAEFQKTKSVYENGQPFSKRRRPNPEPGVSSLPIDEVEIKIPQSKKTAVHCNVQYPRNKDKKRKFEEISNSYEGNEEMLELPQKDSFLGRSSEFPIQKDKPLPSSQQNDTNAIPSSTCHRVPSTSSHQPDSSHPLVLNQPCFQSSQEEEKVAPPAESLEGAGLNDSVSAGELAPCCLPPQNRPIKLEKTQPVDHNASVESHQSGLSQPQPIQNSDESISSKVVDEQLEKYRAMYKDELKDSWEIWDSMFTKQELLMAFSRHAIHSRIVNTKSIPGERSKLPLSLFVQGFLIKYLLIICNEIFLDALHNIKIFPLDMETIIDPSTALAIIYAQRENLTARTFYWLQELLLGNYKLCWTEIPHFFHTALIETLVICPRVYRYIMEHIFHARLLHNYHKVLCLPNHICVKPRSELTIMANAEEGRKSYFKYLLSINKVEEYDFFGMSGICKEVHVKSIKDLSSLDPKEYTIHEDLKIQLRSLDYQVGYDDRFLIENRMETQIRKNEHDRIVKNHEAKKNGAPLARGKSVQSTDRVDIPDKKDEATARKARHLPQSQANERRPTVDDHIRRIRDASQRRELSQRRTEPLIEPIVPQTRPLLLDCPLRPATLHRVIKPSAIVFGGPAPIQGTATMGRTGLPQPPQ